MTDNLILANKQDVIRIADALREREGTLDSYTWASLVEKAIQAINAKGEDASLLPLDSIPKYVRQEAVRVANEVQKRIDKYGSNSIVFIALSDTHLTADTPDQENGYTDNNYIQPIHALMAAKIIAYALDIDFIVHTGDVAGGRPATARAADDIDEIKRQANIVLARMKETFKNYPIFCAIGNHDSGEYYDQGQGDAGNYMMDGEFLYNNFTKLCDPEDGAIGGADTGGYCYKDIINKELRVFLLNTSERYIKKKGWNNNSNNYKWMSQNQLTWFKNNATTLPEGYNFIVLSHFPADYADDYNFSNTLKEIIEANQEKTFIAQFHGHLHNYLQDKLYQDTNTQYDAYKICIPSVESRNNQYWEDFNGKFADPRPTDITKGTVGVAANETSFVVNIINSDRDIIESIHYGAGYDRILGIGDTTYYTISSILTNATLESEFSSSIAEGETYYGTLNFKDDYKYKSVQIEYNGDYTYDEVTGLITIENVQSDIKIIASGVNYKNILLDAGYTYGPAIAPDGQLSGAYETYTTGFIPFKYTDIVYFKNIGFNTSYSSNANRLCFYGEDADKNKIFLGSLGNQHTKQYHYNIRYPEEDTTKDMIQFQMKSTGSKNMYNDKSNDAFYTNEIKYLRVTSPNISPSSVITINENPYEDDPDNPFNNWSVNLSLTNVTSTNSAITVTKGKPYSTTLEATNDYELGNITVKMGGTDISANSGVITMQGTDKAVVSISSVTGDLDIKASYKFTLPPVGTGNQIKNAVLGDGVTLAYNGKGYGTGTISSSNPTSLPTSGTGNHTGFIRFDLGKYINFENIIFNKTIGQDSNGNYNGSNARIYFYDEHLNPLGVINANMTDSSYIGTRVPSDVFQNLQKIKPTGKMAKGTSIVTYTSEIKYIAVSIGAANAITDQSVITFTDS